MYSCKKSSTLSLRLVSCCFCLLTLLVAGALNTFFMNGIINWLDSSSRHSGERVKLLLANPFRLLDSIKCSGTTDFFVVQSNHIHTLFLKWVAKLFGHMDQLTDILTNEVWMLGVWSWSHMSSCLPESWLPSWNSSITQATSGPAIIQLLRTAGLSVRPTAPPSPLMQALFCSFA